MQHFKSFYFVLLGACSEPPLKRVRVCNELNSKQDPSASIFVDVCTYACNNSMLLFCIFTLCYIYYSILYHKNSSIIAILLCKKVAIISGFYKHPANVIFFTNDINVYYTD